MRKENIIAPINQELNIVKNDTENIKNLIYTIRGKQVMLDRDVALLYHYETKRINQAVKRNKQILERLRNVEYKILEYDKKIDEVFNKLQKEQKKEFEQKIFFNGEIYDSYSLIIDIIKTAKSKILIIDNYIDDSILSMLSKKEKDVEVLILTSQNCSLTKLDINKFNKQYPTLKIARTNKFHDRFLVIDNEELYHVGASLKDLGKKCFAISKLEDMEYVKRISDLSM